ncbi:hypothetical protein SADUNF_Sadunf16G0122000 [Salix dunnii]|uniref:Uncharacterized protein n=1 Tax=Salix dunnii TaxID=1413687 RepID=A0A835J6D8_9ROSI|nr:hypothetical protein SADUNF_Sadunf16G0122000 [Salix dunnii]
MCLIGVELGQLVPSILGSFRGGNKRDNLFKDRGQNSMKDKKKSWKAFADDNKSRQKPVSKGNGPQFVRARNAHQNNRAAELTILIHGVLDRRVLQLYQLGKKPKRVLRKADQIQPWNLKINVEWGKWDAWEARNLKKYEVKSLRDRDYLREQQRWQDHLEPNRGDKDADATDTDDGGTRIIWTP